MDFSLRLYRMHDADLMMLYRASNVSFVKIVKQILNSYANGSVYQIDVSKTWLNKELKDLPYTSMCRLSLHEEKDIKVIQLLNQITDGYKNSFIKQVIRLYLSPYSISSLFIDREHAFIPTKFPEQVYQPFMKGTKKKSKKKEKNVNSITAKTSVVAVPQHQADTTVVTQIPAPIQTTVQSQTQTIPTQTLVQSQTQSQTPIQTISDVQPQVIPAQTPIQIQPSYTQEQIQSKEEETQAANDFFANLMNGF